jgi:hypothetical protein
MFCPRTSLGTAGFEDRPYGANASPSFDIYHTAASISKRYGGTRLHWACCYWDLREHCSSFVRLSHRRELIRLQSANCVHFSHGFDSTAILLGRYNVWRFATTGYKIRMDGTGMHAICLVRCSTMPSVFSMLICSAQLQPRRAGSHCSPEFRTRGCRSSTAGARMPFSSLR